MITFWAPGRRFSDTHHVAIRYADRNLADTRMREPNFPKEECVTVEWCNTCFAFHIIRNPTNI